MYEFRSVTARVEDFHERIRNRTLQTDSERAMIITESYKKNEHVVPIIKRCMATYDVCSKMTLRVEDFSIFVGNKGKTFCGSGSNPEWRGAGWVPYVIASGEWGEVQEDGLYHNPETEELKLAIAPEDVENLNSIAEYWKDKSITTMANAWQPDGYDELCRLNVCKNVPGGPLMMMTAGHLTPGYPRLIEWGYGKIRKFAQDWLDEHRCDLMGDGVTKSLFYKGVTIMCDAVSTLIRRYGQLCAEKAAECTDVARTAELRMMSDGLMWIAENPPRSYWEACQTMLIYQLFLNIENMYPAPSFGRFDQLTWPCLKNDLDSGKLTMDEAQEITDFFFLHANTFYVGFPGKGLAATTGIGNTYQHTTIGGCDPKTGKDATNPVTYMVLESVGRLSLHDPTVSLRTGKDTPDLLWDCAIETTKLVGGLPLFQNDEIIIPGLMKELDFELEDARDYCFIGCQEITGHGNDYSAGNGISPPNASIHYATVIDMALNNGVNPFNGEQCTVKTGYLYDMTSMDEVREAVKRIATFVTKAQVSFDNYTEYLTQHYATTVGLSLSMIGCLESGKDCTWGGAKYNSYGGTATGLATIADSLSTIKYMCFDKKLCTTRELYDAFMANWEGYEGLRQRILNEVPHFGNNDPYADAEMKWICDTYYEICQQCNSTRAKHYKSGLYGASDHVAQGYRAWATPDGRKTGEPIADASSPAQGRDISGPTAVLLSECCFDHSKFMDGLALNIRIHPTALNGEDGTAKLRDLTKAYLANGGMEVQYNIVSSETMRAAQADPDAYRNLVVRIAGYSAYFVELNQDCQNDLIARTENSI
jgi:pyruvate formate-lyase/glycerol dehydratase family glycyl radical enzyme